MMPVLVKRSTPPVIAPIRSTGERRAISASSTPCQLMAVPA